MPKLNLVLMILRFLFVSTWVHVMSAQNYSFRTFSVPYPVKNNTVAQGVNNRGAIVGYIDFAVRDQKTGMIVDAKRGFKRDADGVFEYPIIDPNDDTWHFTSAYGINETGEIVGKYRGSDSEFQGFLLSDGKFRTVDELPGGSSAVYGINNKGDYVGATGLQQNPGVNGFANVNGQLIAIDVAGATATVPSAIAQDDTVVGCAAISGVVQGFIRGPLGRYFTFSAPGAVFTCAVGINNQSHMIVGDYQDSTGITHGFVYDYTNLARDGQTGILPVITVDFPGSYQTVVTGVNSRGLIVGWAIVLDQGGSLTPTFSFIGTPK